jgi:hypothetical protein
MNIPKTHENWMKLTTFGCRFVISPTCGFIIAKIVAISVFLNFLENKSLITSVGSSNIPSGRLLGLLPEPTNEVG